MQDGRFALVDGGQSPCNLVDVGNLTRAIMLALTCERADATRLFITDDEETTWADVVQALAPLLPTRTAVPSITREEAVAMQPATPRRRVSPVETVRFLATARIRCALRQDPLLERGEAGLRSVITMLPRQALDHLRMWVNGPITVPKTQAPSRFDRALSKIQLRGVRHRCDQAKAVLGYAPEYSFAASMEVFRSWYETMYCYGSSEWLVKEL
jgi:nucleoside-diphosphate-sugar epimerase